MKTLEEAASKVVSECMGLKPEEKLLVVYDDNKREIAIAIFEEAFKISNYCNKYKVPAGQVNGEEPPAEAAAYMKNCDVCVIVTTVSHSHTKARRDASEKGVRIASMPGVTEDMLTRTMDVDYQEVKEFSMKLKEKLDCGKKVRVTTEKGTDINMGIDGREAMKPGGILHDAGDFGNLPEGEACIAPVEGTAEGTFVIDGSILSSKVDEDIKVHVKGGHAVSIEGGKSAEELKNALERAGNDAYNIAELGIGTNKAAKITGSTLEDEKVYGTAHIAFGNNKSFGGNVDAPIHLDGVFHEPTIYVDDKMIMEKGHIV